ncbi:hypothetical protein EOI86_18990 [Hwanghaeella grinnelliae]|uniref:Polysaccharide lyase n=1 Tax=Hwanghaeella grinnelliae TaxID=2500179 RepID=A0A3S2Z6I5_9PROT|nr:hypothetical protein EOI86_18990 [Hwanghaeella grinnelliae]
MAGLLAAIVFLTTPALAQQAVSPSLERGDFGPFVRSLNEKPYGYMLVPDPTGNAPTAVVERFELRDGDCGVNGAWSDCEKDRERSELREMGARSPEGTEAWYGWSFYLPQDWPDVWPTKTVLGQFHQIRSHPIWMFLLKNGGLVLDDQSTGRTTRTVELIPKDDLRDRWHRVEINANWRNDDQGFFRVWIDGETKIAWTGPTMDAETVYFRYGVYRSFVSRFKNATGADTMPTQTAYFANVRRAAAREGLAAPGDR